jgi:hypothetical protein
VVRNGSSCCQGSRFLGKTEIQSGSTKLAPAENATFALLDIGRTLGKPGRPLISLSGKDAF